MGNQIKCFNDENMMKLFEFKYMKKKSVSYIFAT